MGPYRLTSPPLGSCSSTRVGVLEGQTETRNRLDLLWRCVRGKHDYHVKHRGRRVVTRHEQGRRHGRGYDEPVQGKGEEMGRFGKTRCPGPKGLVGRV